MSHIHINEFFQFVSFFPCDRCGEVHPDIWMYEDIDDPDMLICQLCAHNSVCASCNRALTDEHVDMGICKWIDDDLYCLNCYHEIREYYEGSYYHELAHSYISNNLSYFLSLMEEGKYAETLIPDHSDSSRTFVVRLYTRYSHDLIGKNVYAFRRGDVCIYFRIEKDRTVFPIN